LDEIEKICTHVAIMRKGELLQIGSIQEILSQERLVLLKARDLTKLKEIIDQSSDVKFIDIRDNELIVSVADEFETDLLNKMIAEKGIYLSGIKEHRKNLETTFLEIIKS
jgi:ABC-2 type transport system ATP-binding protein